MNRKLILVQAVFVTMVVALAVSPLDATGSSASNATAFRGAGPLGNTGNNQGNSSPAEVTCPGTPVQCFADVAPGSTFFDFANHVYEQQIVTGYACGGPGEPCDGDNRPYYRPNNSVTRAQMSKFTDNARTQPGIAVNG